MEEIVAEELEIERKLKILEEKSKTCYKLRDITKPEDLRAIADEERGRALERNANLLQELDFQIAKLHTKRLCPLQKKLNDVIDKSYGVKQCSKRGSVKEGERKKIVFV